MLKAAGTKPRATTSAYSPGWLAAHAAGTASSGAPASSVRKLSRARSSSTRSRSRIAGGESPLGKLAPAPQQLAVREQPDFVDRHPGRRGDRELHHHPAAGRRDVVAHAGAVRGERGDQRPVRPEQAPGEDRRVELAFAPAPALRAEVHVVARVGRDLVGPVRVRVRGRGAAQALAQERVPELAHLEVLLARVSVHQLDRVEIDPARLPSRRAQEQLGVGRLLQRERGIGGQSADAEMRQIGLALRARSRRLPIG